LTLGRKTEAMPIERSLWRKTKRNTERPFSPACEVVAQSALAGAWDDRNVAGLERLSAGWDADKRPKAGTYGSRCK
jgi:hypothetical protein